MRAIRSDARVPVALVLASLLATLAQSATAQTPSPRACDTARRQGITLPGCAGARRPPVAGPPTSTGRREPTRPTVRRGTAPAAAQGASQQWASCTNASEQFAPEEAIEGCSVLIQSGRLTSAFHARASFHRGVAYLSQGAYSHAIGDYTDAIRLDP